MLQISEALREMQNQLLGYTQDPLRSSDSAPTLPNLARTVERLEKTIGAGAVPKPPLDPEMVWEKWSTERFAPEVLNRAEWRTLCTSSETALRPQLISRLKRNREPLSRLSNILGLAYAYFFAWRPESVANDVEKIIRQALDGSFGSSRNAVIVCWRSNRFLFSVEAASRIGELALEQHRPLREVADQLFVDANSQLYSRAVEDAALKETKAILARQASLREDEVCRRLDWAMANLYGSELQATIYRNCIGQLVTSSLPERFQSVRRILLRNIYEDKRLRDPRLTDAAPNWRSMPKSSRETVLSWLAEDTLQFFFNTIVPQNDENRRRADFWLRYVRKYNNVRDFQVAVSREDVWKVEHSRASIIPSYARVDATGNASSAFLMAFEGHGERYVIVEFSETGNAACIYTKAAFEQSGATFRSQRYSMSALKNTATRIDSIIHHVGTWERNAAEKLRKLGITA